MHGVPSFAGTVPGLTPHYLSCVIGAFEGPGPVPVPAPRTHVWNFRSTIAPDVSLKVAAVTVGAGDAGAVISFTVPDPLGGPPIASGFVAHPAAPGEVIVDVPLSGLTVGAKYALIITSDPGFPPAPGGQHYKVGAVEPKVELGIAHLEHYPEEGINEWALHLAPGEPVDIERRFDGTRSRYPGHFSS
jgi:hypothetical protein